MTMQEVIEILKGLLTPVIGVIAVYIGYQQHKTNRSRELRESRKAKLDVYKKVSRFMRDIDASRSVDKDAYEVFEDALAEADFLFPEDLTEWLSGISLDAMCWVDGDRMISDFMEENNLPSREDFYIMVENSPSWQKEAQYMEKSIEALQNAHGDLKEKFSKYLTLK